MALVFPIPLHVMAQVQLVFVRLGNIGATALVLLIVLIAIQIATHLIAELPLKHHVKALAADGASPIPRRTAMTRAIQLLANQILRLAIILLTVQALNTCAMECALT